MAAHRSWRALVSRGNSSIVAIGELTLRTVAGGAQAATGGTAYASSVWGAGFEAAKAFDGVVGAGGGGTNCWESAASFQGGDEWVAYDFGAGNEKDIVEVIVATFVESTSYIPARILMQWSDNGTNWVSMSPALTPTMSSFGTYTCALAAVTAPRQRRMMARVNPGWPNPAQLQRRLPSKRLKHDANDGGAFFRVAGTVKLDASPDVPVARRVRLFEQSTGRCIRETWSDPTTGAYEFKLLKNQRYFVVSTDHTESYNAVIKDNLTPEAMS